MQRLFDGWRSVRGGRPMSKTIRRVVSVLVLAVVASLPGMVPAYADTTVDMALWNDCASGSSGSLSFSAESVNWLDQVQLSYTAHLDSFCGFNATTVSIVENTAQTND